MAKTVIFSTEQQTDESEQVVTSLYAHYGSRLTSGTSELLYDAILADEVLAPFFETVDMDALREHMADFIGALTGGPDMYKGRNMAQAHAPFMITADHFQRVADHLLTSLQAAGIEEAHSALIMEEVAKLRAEVVNAEYPHS